MGNSGSSVWDRSLKQEYVLSEQFTHSVLGAVRVFKHKTTGQEVFMKQIEAISLGSYNETKYRQRQQLQDPRLVRVLDMGIVRRGGGTCNGSQQKYLFTGIWDYPGTKTIARVIENRSEPWAEMKVWQIAAQLIDPLAKLETIGLAHSDIRPSSIFVKQDAVLLAEPSVIPGLGSAYQRAIDGDKPYLSPQQMDELKQFRLQPKSNTLKNDVYAFGMTILHCMTLKNCLYCYDYDNYAIVEERVKQLLSSCNYSRCLISFVEYCLTPTEDARPTFGKLLQLISPYMRDIAERKEFFLLLTFQGGRFQQQSSPAPRKQSVSYLQADMQRTPPRLSTLNTFQTPVSQQYNPSPLPPRPMMMSQPPMQAPIRPVLATAPNPMVNSIRSAYINNSPGTNAAPITNFGPNPNLASTTPNVASTPNVAPTPIRRQASEPRENPEPNLDQRIKDALMQSQQILERHNQMQYQR